MKNVVNKNIYFECTYHGRYSQTERADLYIDGELVGHGSYRWENRPWQAFDFDIAMTKALEKASKKISSYRRRTIKKWLDNGGKREMKKYSSVAMVASLSSLLTDNQKEANDWKARMLKAGLPEGALQMPDDWNELDEDEKQRRLDGAIKIIG